MSPSQTSPKVDAYIGQASQWREETKQLRKILLGCGLAEDLKWGKPCYAFQAGNVAVIQGFKAYCALLFFKGVLLKDRHGILVKTGPNTRVGRQVRFTSVRDIVGMESHLKACIREAIELEKAGLKVEIKTGPEPVPEELQKKMDDVPALKKAFNALTPGRQRAYIFYFSAAKQSQTRVSRIEKWLPQILKGKGLNDP
jgi:uncharacterized protein YdeI (YjbR/CyaY-like superfamily)